MAVITLGQVSVAVLGDVNGDGFVGEDDAELAAQAVAGKIILTPEQLLRAKVTGSGKLSIVDALQISKYAEGLINSFPAGPGAPRKPKMVEEPKRELWPWLVAVGIAAYMLLGDRK